MLVDHELLFRPLASYYVLGVDMEYFSYTITNFDVPGNSKRQYTEPPHKDNIGQDISSRDVAILSTNITKINNYNILF